MAAEMKRTLKERLLYGLYLTLVTPLSWLPLPALYLLSDGLRLLMHRVLKYRRATVRENLSSSYPEATPEQLREYERDFYRQFCDNLVETVKLLNISDKTIDSRVEVVDADLVDQAAAQGRSVILYLGHYGNWEWVPAIQRHYRRPGISCQIYKPLHDRAFDRLMLKVRSRFGSLSIDMDVAFRQLLRIRKEYGTFICGFIADSRTSWQPTRYVTEFLRHPTMFYPGGEELGRRMDAEFLYLDVECLSRGHYRMTFRPIVPPPGMTEYPYTREYLRMMQATIDRRPGCWMWSHKRWPASLQALIKPQTSNF